MGRGQFGFPLWTQPASRLTGAGDEGGGCALPTSVRPPGPQLPRGTGLGPVWSSCRRWHQESNCSPLEMLGYNQPGDSHVHSVAMGRSPRLAALAWHTAQAPLLIDGSSPKARTADAVDRNVLSIRSSFLKHCGSPRHGRVPPTCPQSPSFGATGSQSRSQPTTTAGRPRTTKRQVRGCLTCGGSGGQGRGRTADLPIFSRTLVPTELPGLA